MKKASSQQEKNKFVMKRILTYEKATAYAVVFVIVVMTLASLIMVNATSYFENQPFTEQTLVATAGTNGYVGGYGSNAYYFWSLYSTGTYTITAVGHLGDTYACTGLATDNFTYNNNSYQDLYYITGTYIGWSSSQINNVLPVFDTVLEGVQALYDELENLPDPPISGYPLNYTLPAGNIAYLEIDSSLFNGVSLATIMPELSGVGSGDPWSLSSQFYAMTDDMLSNGDSVYDLNGTRIVWSKSSNASTNLLGQTDHAVWQSEGPYPNKTYFVICNPFYFLDNENNSSITIVANGIKNVYVQPLKTIVQQNSNEISYNTTVDGGTYVGEVTDDLGPIDWTDPDGGNTAPGTSTSNTPVPGINQFQQWLQGILQQIISVFEPAHDAITTLASAVQNFSGWLKALYIWLPSPVLNLLTSAISLAIIIGVIKVFI